MLCANALARYLTRCLVTSCPPRIRMPLPIKRLPRSVYALLYTLLLMASITSITVLSVPRLNVESEFLASLSESDNPYVLLATWVSTIGHAHVFTISCACALVTSIYCSLTMLGLQHGRTLLSSTPLSGACTLPSATRINAKRRHAHACDSITMLADNGDQHVECIAPSFRLANGIETRWSLAL